MPFTILRYALLFKRGSRPNHVLKDIDEFSLAFDNAGLRAVAWAKFPYKQP